MSVSKEEINFEEALDKIEKVVKELEDGGLSLDKSLEIFTEGIKLIKFCNKELNQAEKKIEMVLCEDNDYSDAIVPYTQGEELN